MVRALSNNFTTEGTTRSLSFTTTSVRLSNGAVTVSNGYTSHREDHHARINKTSNSFRYIGGFIPFRDPSTYQRRMINLIGQSPAYYVTVSPTFRTTVSGYPQNSHLADHVQLWTYPLDEFGDYKDGNPLNHAITECLVKLGDGKIQMGAYLAESVKTANQIADLGSSIVRDLLHYYRRIHTWRRSPWEISREVADGYLGYKYGIKPLAHDLYSMAQLWNMRNKDYPHVLSASHNVISRESKTHDNGVWINRNQRSVHLAQCKLFGKVSDATLRRIGQLGLINPASVAWELVPYSFVVDWVLPVGSFLEALAAPAGVDFVSGYTMTRTSFKNSAARRLPTGAVGTPWTLEYEGLTHKRNKLGGFPTPVPYVKNPFSTGNVLSALALFRQLLKRY